MWLVIIILLLLLVLPLSMGLVVGIGRKVSEKHLLSFAFVNGITFFVMALLGKLLATLLLKIEDVSYLSGLIICIVAFTIFSKGRKRSLFIAAIDRDDIKKYLLSCIAAGMSIMISFVGIEFLYKLPWLSLGLFALACVIVNAVAIRSGKYISKLAYIKLPLLIAGFMLFLAGLFVFVKVFILSN
ncbi:MAG: hypothetical protein PHU62_01425 [Bacteroidales bacterium]|jgi:hypothetical protein|nr:hypothetical protein [Bacteroidales bacterium]MDD2203978.1 hypothetical protein [Bacteroidales bacterium]MDD3151888.1 hypothetical protein [Bacteroidales bacterium]MDD3913433.1 hypothetical protein [Bacteroidales bacterium]MDD4633229.1 hypothetical protein [Bacteroidales bacterium]